MLIELSLEPWLIEPISDSNMDTQLKRMDIKKFDEIINFAEKTNFSKQYLWGVEWWYWMKSRGNSEFFDKAKEIFAR